MLQSLGVTLNTMTLGGLAISIGVVVDDAVIDVENIVRRLRVPIMALSGIAGRLFSPLGLSYILAVLASLLVALTVTPARHIENVVRVGLDLADQPALIPVEIEGIMARPIVHLGAHGVEPHFQLRRRDKFRGEPPPWCPLQEQRKNSGVGRSLLA